MTITEHVMRFLIHSFYDSNDDGIGDLNGLAKKLDYITGAWMQCRYG